MFRNLIFNNIRPFVRRMSTQTGQKEIKEVTKVDASGKTTIIKETITTARETWNNLSPLKKKLIGAYIAVGATDNLFGSYQQGKVALEDYRKDDKEGRDRKYWTPRGERKANNEWQAVYLGCREGMMGRFMASCIWPASIFGRVMPSVVLYLNPPASAESSNK